MSKSTATLGELTPSTVLGIHHIGMVVRDLAAAVDFYRSAAALELVSQKPLGGARPQRPGKTALLKAPNGYVELMQFASAAHAEARSIPVEGPGMTHLCFQSPVQVGLYDRFKRLQATPVSRGDHPVDLNGRGVRYAYARDADNIMFEVEELEAPNFEGPIWLAHIALVSPDIDRLVAFYQNLFGIEPYGYANKVVGPRFEEVTGLDNVRIRAAWFNTGNMVLEIWEYVMPATPQVTEPLAYDAIGYNKVAYEVGDLGSERKRLAETGIEFLNEAVVNRGVQEVCFRDPDGNLISLLQTEPEAPARVANLKHIDWLPSPASSEGKTPNA